MSTQNILNIIGMGVNMIGSFLMFYYSPKVVTGTYIYKREELQKLLERDKKSNNMIKYGMLLLFFGFLFQLAALLFF